jgi:hypothetical protein
MSPPRLRSHGWQSLQRLSPDHAESKISLSKAVLCSSSGNLTSRMAVLASRGQGPRINHVCSHVVRPHTKLANSEMSSTRALAALGGIAHIRPYASGYDAMMLRRLSHSQLLATHGTLGHRCLATDARFNPWATSVRCASQRSNENCTVCKVQLKASFRA